MYKFTYQVLDFNTVDDQFVVLVKTTDSKVEKQEEIIHIDYAEDQITEADFKELGWDKTTDVAGISLSIRFDYAILQF